MEYSKLSDEKLKKKSNQNNKKAALQFLKLVVAGKIDEAYEKFVDINGRHHNTFFHAGFPALREAMKENHAKFPNKQLEVKNVLSDGELVAVHSHLDLKPDEAGLIVVHLFRFKNGKIAEMWDCGQAIQNDSPNKDGAF